MPRDGFAVVASALCSPCSSCTGDIDATWCLRRYIKPRGGSLQSIFPVLTSCLLPPCWHSILRLLGLKSILFLNNCPKLQQQTCRMDIRNSCAAGPFTHKNNYCRQEQQYFDIKGTVLRDFRLSIFSWNSFARTPVSIPTGPFQIFFKFADDSRSRSSVVDTGGKWKKSLIRKVLIILFGHKFFPSNSL